MINAHIMKGAEPLNIAVWEKVNLNLLVKALAELMHEQVALPVMNGKDEDGLTHFRLNTDQEEVYYTFSAYPHMLDYWHILKPSVKKNSSGQSISATDVVTFFIEMQQTFGIKSFTLAHYTEELLHTLYADAFIHTRGRLTATQLADAGYQTIEYQMDGHPWVIVNKGRLGFDHQDYLNYAPEAAGNLKLIWIAVHKSRATFSALKTINEQAFYESELGKNTFNTFKNQLAEQDVNVSQYGFIPVHEWQWNNKILVQFAADIAQKLLIPLGYGTDIYLAQQSIRTLYNSTNPHKNYVKTAVSILSTGNIRGLSPKQMVIAPRITEWVRNMLDTDNYLQNLGLVLLGEVATVAYLHPHYSAISNPPYQYNEFLGVLWRESAEKYLQPGESMMTMAALLYVDDEDKSMVGALINQSGLSPAAWLNAYLRTYLKPLLHIYYRHSLCVTPHGENIILIMKNHVPVRMIIKDFVDDIVLTAEAITGLPPELADKMIQSSNKSNVPLFILLGVFDAFFRYLGNVLHTYAGYGEENFWEQVVAIISEYQEEHPDLQSKFEQYDLFVPEFSRFYINSQRLFHGYEEGTSFAIPKKGGVLSNPLALVKNQQSAFLKPA